MLCTTALAQASLSQVRHILDRSCNARTVQEATPATPPRLNGSLGIVMRWCQALTEVRGFASLGHNLWSYAYLRMLHHKDADVSELEDDSWVLIQGSQLVLPDSACRASLPHANGLHPHSWRGEKGP